jgi:hypothetical protein
MVSVFTADGTPAFSNACLGSMLRDGTRTDLDVSLILLHSFASRKFPIEYFGSELHLFVSGLTMKYALDIIVQKREEVCRWVYLLNLVNGIIEMWPEYEPIKSLKLVLTSKHDASRLVKDARSDNIHRHVNVVNDADVILPEISRRT